MSSKVLRTIAASVLAASAVTPVLQACGSDKITPVNYGEPPDSSIFDTGGGGSSPYGYGEGGTTSVPEAAPPVCPDSLKQCAETFTYPYNGEQTVELRGNYNPTAWTNGNM